MNSPHSMLYSVIAFMLLSSIVALVMVSIQNHRAVKKYYKALEAGEVPTGTMDNSYDPEDFEEVIFFEKGVPSVPEYKEEKTREHLLAS